MKNTDNTNPEGTTPEAARAGSADTDAARLYVGTFAKYNAGSIRGAWLALDDYADHADFLAACRELHKDEADPELMFQDFENFPRCLYDESAGAPRYWQVKEACERHGMSMDLAAAYADHVGDKLDEDTVEAAAERYCGAHRNAEAFAEHILYEAGDLSEIPEHLRSYFDFEAYARDLFMGDYIEVDCNGFHVFANH